MNLAPKLVLAAGALIVALPAQAQPQPSSATLSCFLRSDIRNHTVGDAHTLYFDVNGRDTYRVTMSNACLASAVSSDPIVMRDRTGSGRVCHKMDLDISVRGSGCIVDRVEKMTPQEVAALPKKVRP